MLGCPYINDFQWTECFPWKSASIENLRKINLASKCQKSFLKGRELRMLFLLDYNHLPWFILLSDKFFTLKLVLRTDANSMPPETLTLNTVQ